MQALFFLIPLSLLALLVAVAFFLRMNTSGQFDEPESAAWSVLMDDDNAVSPSSSKPKSLDACQKTSGGGNLK